MIFTFSSLVGTYLGKTAQCRHRDYEKREIIEPGARQKKQISKGCHSKCWKGSYLTNQEVHDRWYCWIQMSDWISYLWLKYSSKLCLHYTGWPVMSTWKILRPGINLTHINFQGVIITPYSAVIYWGSYFKSECTEKSSKIGKSWPQLKT